MFVVPQSFRRKMRVTVMGSSDKNDADFIVL
jgi:hypothetical protein